MAEVTLFMLKKDTGKNALLRPVNMMTSAFAMCTPQALTEGIISKAVEGASGRRPDVVNLSNRGAVCKAKGDVALVSINYLDSLRFFAASNQEIFLNFKTVVIGGQLPSMASGPFSRMFPDANLFVGECEESMKTVLDDAGNGKQGLIYRAEPVDIRKNYLVMDRAGSSFAPPMELGRGCKYACDFCGMPSNVRPVRTRDPEQAKEEIGRLRNVWFVDPNLSSYSADYLYNIFSYMEQKRKPWIGEASAKELQAMPDLWDLMSRTCVALLNGVENIGGMLGSWKNGDALLSQPNGSIVVRSMIIGSLDETEQSIERTINAFRENNLTGSFHMLAFTPGTKAFAKAKKDGKLLTNDWNNFDRHHVTMKGDSLSSARLWQLYRKVNRRAHTLLGTAREIARIAAESETWQLAAKRIEFLISLRLRALLTGFEKGQRSYPSIEVPTE